MLYTSPMDLCAVADEQEHASAAKSHAVLAPGDARSTGSTSIVTQGYGRFAITTQGYALGSAGVVPSVARVKIHYNFGG